MHEQCPKPHCPDQTLSVILMPDTLARHPLGKHSSAVQPPRREPFVFHHDARPGGQDGNGCEVHRRRPCCKPVDVHRDCDAQLNEGQPNAPGGSGRRSCPALQFRDIPRAGYTV